MMLKRLIEENLTEFANSDDKKCLLVRGARQVGKTFSVEQFGTNSGLFTSFISINFLKEPEIKAVFQGSLDVDTMQLNITLYKPEAIFIPGKTLIMLDEIQECPEAVTSLKFWAEDGRYKVIATGSMLGIDYKRPLSYPVGYITYADMHPLNFREFLWAAGIQENVIKALRQMFLNGTQVPEAMHSKMMQYLQLYMTVGGMPEVVTTYLNQNSLSATDEKQKSILQDYRYDIAHYAKADVKIKAEKCFFSLPVQLTKDNHKFQYSVVEKGGNKRKYESSLDWLSGAYLVKECKAVTKIEFPLTNFEETDNLRLYPSDIGLFTGMFDYSLKTALHTESGIGYPFIGQAKGGLYEALIADILFKNHHRELYYYKNDTSRIEIEFLIPTKDGVVPIEVKAGNSRSASLDKIIKDENIPYGYKLVSGNVGITGKKRTMPLYMAMFI